MIALRIRERRQLPLAKARVPQAGSANEVSVSTGVRTEGQGGLDMSARYGIDLLSVLNVPASATTTSFGPVSIPPSVSRFLRTLSVLSYETAMSEAWVVHNGIIQTGLFQALGDQADDWPLRIPGLLETGLPFRLFQSRSAVDTSAGHRIEGSGDRWLLQIATQGLSVVLPFDAADYVPDSATRPAYLVARAAGADTETRLTIDTGVLEVSSDGDVLVRPNLSMSPDPYHGALIRFRVEPTQFFVYEESVGIRTGEVVLDLSELVSPPEAMRAGFGPDFRGAYLEELGVYFPRDTPFLVPKSITLREALIGTAFAGEGVIEFAATSEPTPAPTFFDHDGSEVAPDGDNVVRLKVFAPGGIIDSSMRVVAVADAREPWAARQLRARWGLPDGDTFVGPRTEQLHVRPGDVLTYTYSPGAGDTYDPPAEQRYTFQLAFGTLPEGTVARIGLRVQTGSATTAVQDFFDVVHVNAPLAAFVTEGGDAPDLSMRLVALDEQGDPLAETVESTWLVDGRPVPTGSGSTTVVNLADLVDTAPTTLPTDPTPNQEVQVTRSTLRITLSAEGFPRSVTLDVIGDPRLATTRPIVVHRPRDGADWADHWTAEELGVADPLMVMPPGEQHKYHYGTFIAQGQLRPLAGGLERLTGSETSTDGSEAASTPVAVDTVCANYQPGYVYELVPGQPAFQVEVPSPRPTQVTFFFETGTSSEADIVGVRVLFDAQSAHLSSVGGRRVSDAELADLLKGLERGTLEIVGRSSTRSTIEDETSRKKLNTQLGQERAATAETIMGQALDEAGLTGTVTVNPPRGEESPLAELNSDELDGRQNATDRPGGFLEWDKADPAHGDYERADVFITSRASAGTSGPQWATSSEQVGVVGARRALLPCAPRKSAAPIRHDISSSSLERLRITVRWDRDPMPTKIEAMAVWRTSSIQVDAGETTGQTIDKSAIQTEDDLFRLVLALVTDAQSGLSRWSLTFDAAGERDGLFSVGLPPVLGTLFVFGPLFARMAQAEAADGAEVNESGWVTLGVLAAAAAAAEAAEIISDVKLVANGVSIDIDTRGGPFEDFEALYLKLDYSVEFSIKEPMLLGIETHPDHPVRLRFRNVGFAYHQGTGEVRFLFDEEAEGDFSIEDAGTFRQMPDTTGALASLVQVVGARLGQGSAFIELDLRFVIDIGLLEVTQTTIRLIFDDGFRVELRGLGVKIEIPDTIIGEGSLVIRDNGFRATLAIEVVPAKLYAAGSLDFHDMGEWTAVGVGLQAQFPVGLPLGGSGLAIYGLLGAFGANMRRSVTRTGNIVDNEIQWVGRLLNPASRDSAFTPSRNSWTFGVGAVVGTLPDGGSSFHAKGALALELPGPTVLFGIDVRFIEQRRGTDGGDDLTSAIVGLIGITEQAFIIGIRVDLSLGDILHVKIPIDALFPTQLDAANRPAGYLRIGSDGSGGRGGDPVMIELKLADFVGVEAWLFLMIEEKGIVDLGRKYLGTGSTGFPDLQGFSIGFGMGISLFLGVREIGTFLEVELLAIAGMGTSPIVIGGFIQAKGTLSILWVGFSVSAMLDFLHRQPGPVLPPGQADGSEITEPETTFRGKFCAEINFFFFSIKECFEFELGTGDPCAAPAPPPLIPRVGFIDRRGFEMASAELDEQTGTQLSEPVVWPDTTVVLDVLAEPRLDLPAASPFAETLTSTDHRSLRVGEFDYDFRLDDLRLERFDGGTWVSVADELDAAMWFPTGRPAFDVPDSDAGAGQAGNGAEVRSIGLLTWDPIPWTRALVPGAHPGVESHLVQSADNLCDRPIRELQDCAPFQKATPAGVVGRWNVRGEQRRADLVAGVDAEGPAELAQRILQLELDEDVQLTPMSRVDFVATVSTPGGPRTGGLRCAQFLRLVGDRLVAASTLAARLDLAREQYHGTLLLLVSATDHEFNSGTEVLLPGPHEAIITERQASVVVTATDGATHLVPGVNLGRVQLGEKVNTDGYDLWLFETQESPLRDGDFRSWHIPATTADVVLLEACGWDTRTRQQSEDRNDAAEDAAEGLDRHTGDDLAPSRFVLQADAQHRITARWTWSGERITDPLAADDDGRVECTGPPTTGTVAQEFTFRTAAVFDPDAVPVPAEGALPPPPAAENSDIVYSTFDVRDLDQYLKRVPDFDDPPTFLDDLIHVEYYVDHIVDLLDRYGRTLKLEVVRTDTPTPADTVPIRFPILGSLDRWEAILFAALAEQSCISGELPGRGAGELLQANLEPNARYDLLVSGPRTGTTESLDHHRIRRAPFRTSRYTGPAALLRELGWAPETEPLAFRPQDLVLESEVSTALPARAPADVDFEQGLADLRLDLQQQDQPVTTVLWRPPLPSAQPETPTLSDGLARLGLLGRDVLDIAGLVELLVRRARFGGGFPVLPRPPFDSFRPVPTPIEPDPFRPPFRPPHRFDIPLDPRRRPGRRYGLTWFHDLLAAEDLDENGAVVEQLGARLTLAFRSPLTGGIKQAVSLLSRLVRELFERPDPPPPQGWRIAGIIMESLEPIERDGRLSITSMTVGTPAVQLTLRRSNSARSRLLFLAETAVELGPGLDPRLRIEVEDDHITGVTDGRSDTVTDSLTFEHHLGRTPQTVDWEV